ncbi:filament-like plant protein [Euphorbia lathyris]|uniref:filament-like plant protein n=1 Tax=Euphorbia lathyris TaxID=212925 RepID=UPI003313D9E0
MEKRKWLWKRKSSERSPGETESSGSVSSLSERFSDEQDTSKASPTEDSPSPEVTSKTAERDEDVDDRIKNLTVKLSAALVNVSAKDDLVKQHSKVAEEAVAGWEKAENEVSALKQQLEAAVQKNSVLEDRVTHLDGALKECVRQLRQSREEQEEKVQQAVARKTREWESAKSELENQLVELKVEAETAKSASPSQIGPDFYEKLEHLERDNASLKLDLFALAEELELRTIERDLSTQAAETASKQHLESIKKVSKLEAECRRLKAVAYKSTSLNDHKNSTASSIYVESLTDSQSDSGERLNAAELDTRKTSEPYKCETSCSDSWASALIAELDQFKNEKVINRNLPSSPSIEIDLMDDFLEMERLAAMPEPEKTETHNAGSQAIAKQSVDAENSLRTELESMTRRAADLEEKLQKMEGEKVELEEKLEKLLMERTELEMTLTVSRETNEELQIQLREAGLKLEELQEELLMETESKDQIVEELQEKLLMENESKDQIVEELQEELLMETESKEQIESQLVIMEAEVRTITSKANSLEVEVEKEKALSAEMKVKCKALEEELFKTKQEIELQQSAISNNEPKLKQEDIAAAAGKLAECQKTIASLGKQLKSLATLEDFLIDTDSLPEFSAGESAAPDAGSEPWRLHSSETFSPNRESTSSAMSKNEGNSPPSSSSISSSAVPISYEKNRNGFAKFFSRSKTGNGIQLEI